MPFQRFSLRAHSRNSSLVGDVAGALAPPPPRASVDDPARRDGSGNGNGNFWAMHSRSRSANVTTTSTPVQRKSSEEGRRPFTFSGAYGRARRGSTDAGGSASVRSRSSGEQGRRSVDAVREDATVVEEGVKSGDNLSSTTERSSAATSRLPIALERSGKGTSLALSRKPIANSTPDVKIDKPSKEPAINKPYPPLPRKLSGADFSMGAYSEVISPKNTTNLPELEDIDAPPTPVLNDLLDLYQLAAIEESDSTASTPSLSHRSVSSSTSYSEPPTPGFDLTKADLHMPDMAPPLSPGQHHDHDHQQLPLALPPSPNHQQQMKKEPTITITTASTPSPSPEKEAKQTQEPPLPAELTPQAKQILESALGTAPHHEREILLKFIPQILQISDQIQLALREDESTLPQVGVAAGGLPFCQKSRSVSGGRKVRRRGRESCPGLVESRAESLEGGGGVGLGLFSGVVGGFGKEGAKMVERKDGAGAVNAVPVPAITKVVDVLEAQGGDQAAEQTQLHSTAATEGLEQSFDTTRTGEAPKTLSVTELSAAIKAPESTEVVEVTTITETSKVPDVTGAVITDSISIPSTAPEVPTVTPVATTGKVPELPNLKITQTIQLTARTETPPTAQDQPRTPTKKADRWSTQAEPPSPVKPMEITPREHWNWEKTQNYSKRALWDLPLPDVHSPPNPARSPSRTPRRSLQITPPQQQTMAMARTPTPSPTRQSVHHTPSPSPSCSPTRSPRRSLNSSPRHSLPSSAHHAFLNHPPPPSPTRSLTRSPERKATPSPHCYKLMPNTSTSASSNCVGSSGSSGTAPRHKRSIQSLSAIPLSSVLRHKAPPGEGTSLRQMRLQESERCLKEAYERPLRDYLG